MPLSTQAVGLLRELQAHTGDFKFCFPGARNASRPMSENTVNGALRRIGFNGNEHVGHDFRITASTLLNELGWNPDAIEAQLAHQHGDKIQRTYNKAKFLPERVKMMQAWSDHLDMLRSGTSTMIPSDGFVVTRGEPVIGELHGEHRHYFCSYCMSWLFTRPKGMDQLVNIRAMMLEDASWRCIASRSGRR